MIGVVNVPFFCQLHDSNSCYFIILMMLPLYYNYYYKLYYCYYYYELSVQTFKRQYIFYHLKWDPNQCIIVVVVCILFNLAIFGHKLLQANLISCSRVHIILFGSTPQLIVKRQHFSTSAYGHMDNSKHLSKLKTLSCLTGLGRLTQEEVTLCVIKTY